jgi:hypothetical protein
MSLAACFSSPTTGPAYLRLPEYLDDYVTEDNPMRVIDVFADELDLGALLLALSPTSSSQMISDLMELQPVILESLNAMNAVYGATIERRIRINRPDDENTRCKVSRAWDPRKDFSQCMQQPTTLSTSSAISPQQERTEPSGHRPC